MLKSSEPLVYQMSAQLLSSSLFFLSPNPIQDDQLYEMNFCFYAVLRAQLRNRSAAVMALALDSFFFFFLKHIPFSLPASLGFHPKITRLCLYCVLLCFSFVRILSCSALTLCHIHYGDSFIPLSPDYIVRTVSHYFVLSTFHIFCQKKDRQMFLGIPQNQNVFISQNS